MKVGIITFHWATNYGAVLQAYALQQYLSKKGHNVSIINYCPGTIWIKQRLLAVKNRDSLFFSQERKIKTFRKKYLQLTDARFHSHKQLKKGTFDFDCIIAGSDQIWNESFTLRGEGKITLSYFLDFAPDTAKKIAYAASFGFHVPTPQYVDAVKDAIDQLSAISVRETDGREIVKAFNLDSKVVCDPTALLNKKDYLSLIGDNGRSGEAVFSYMLRENQHDAWSTAKYVGLKYHQEICEKRFVGSMEEWIAHFAHSQIVVTNSFHGIMLSLIMNTPFIAVKIKDSGMNSRITTLLDTVGLATRQIDDFSEETIDRILSEEIDWMNVNQRMNEFRLTGIDFMKSALGE